MRQGRKKCLLILISNIVRREGEGFRISTGVTFHGFSNLQRFFLRVLSTGKNAYYRERLKMHWGLVYAFEKLCKKIESVTVRENPQEQRDKSAIVHI
jgi:hypothetical protein